MNTQVRPSVASAQKISARGFPVIALSPEGKLPLGRDWPQRATTNAPLISAEWARHPGANIGYTLAGHVAVDIDTVEGHGVDGVRAWDMATIGRSIPATWTVTSPSGSTHLVFTLPDGVQVKSRAHALGEGLDIKSGAGAYLVGPGSVTARGVYELTCDRDPAPCPAWLLADLDRAGLVVRAVPSNEPFEPAPPAWEPHGRFGEPIPPGQRHRALLAFCCSMRARRFSWDEAVRLLGERWADCAQPSGQPFTQAEAVALLEDVWTRYPSGTSESDMDSGAPDDAEESSWSPVDLGPYLDGTVERPEPSVGLARSDALRFLYPGKEHAVIGEMECGKSWFLTACAATELLAGRVVVYVHFEEADPTDTVERLRALGVDSRVIRRLLRFVGPERAVTADVLDRLLADGPSLVVFDGVNEAMALHGWGIYEQEGAAAFRRHLVKPCTRAGAATLSADHVAKDPERRGRTSLGAVHKVNGLSGSLVLLENADPFGRGRRGRSHVFVTKDRPGHLRRHGRTTASAGRTYMGELVVDDTREFVSYLDLQVFAPSEESSQGAPAALTERVHEVVSNQPDASVSSERALIAHLRVAGVKIRNTEVRAAIDELIVLGRLVEVPGPRNAKGYHAPATASQDQESNEAV